MFENKKSMWYSKKSNGNDERFCDFGNEEIQGGRTGMKKYDYLVVGSGLYGATFAYEARKNGKTCLVIEKRSHIGGNIYTKNVDGINVHVYGAHIFHTSDPDVWNYVNALVPFKPFINSPIANYKEKIYNLPFNMNTFYALWGVTTPEQAMKKIEETRVFYSKPKNLEEQALTLAGKDIYEKLIKGYTEKQWGRDCKDLPSFIIRRVPLRMTYDNNYFDDVYQGIPVGGYTRWIEKMLEGTEVRLNVNYLDRREEFNALADKIVYTGPIDEFYGYSFGKLEYRTVEFKTERYEIESYQGNAVVNYTDRETPWTRIIEHKHFEGSRTKFTLISKEFSTAWDETKEPYYPVNDEKNTALLKRYIERSGQDRNVLFGGRLGQYRYYNMDQIIKTCLEDCRKEFGK